MEHAKLTFGTGKKHHQVGHIYKCYLFR
jgi:hypothetical protein